MRKKATQAACLGIAVVLFSLWAMMLTGCSVRQNQLASTNPEGEKEGQVKIMTTLFPQYDFARQIAGDKAHITLLLPLGMDSHCMSLTPSNLIAIEEADLFIYTGDYMEGWASGILESINQDHVTVLDVSHGISLDMEEEDGHGHEHHAGDGHNHQFDPHIWTSPVNAQKMVDNILEALCEIDPENADYYRKNAQDYQKKLSDLDQKIRGIVADGERKEVFFGGTFPFHYFFEEYGLEYEAAYDNCSGETEPSVGTMTHMIQEMREEKIPVIYYEELVDPKIARTIAEETGAEMLLFHSCHNVSKDDFERGVTYLDLMNQNAEHLKEGLGVSAET